MSEPRLDGEPSVRRQVAIFTGAILLAFGLQAGYTTWSVNNARAALEHAEQQAQAAARKQGEEELETLCTTLTKLAADKPPPGNPKTNPSRAYLQSQHVILSQLGTDIKCSSLPKKDR